MRGEVKKSDMVVISVSAKQSDVGRDLYFFVLTKICVRRAEVKGSDIGCYLLFFILSQKNLGEGQLE